MGPCLVFLCLVQGQKMDGPTVHRPSRIFLLSNFNIQSTGIVAGQSNTLGTVLLVT